MSEIEQTGKVCKGNTIGGNFILSYSRMGRPALWLVVFVLI